MAPSAAAWSRTPAKDAKGGGDDKDAKKVADTMPSGGIKLVDKFNTGIDFRYQHTLAYDNYFNEPSNTWDLSAPRSQIAYVNFAPPYYLVGTNVGYPVTPGAAGIDFPIPGHYGRNAEPGFDQR